VRSSCQHSSLLGFSYSGLACTRCGSMIDRATNPTHESTEELVEVEVDAQVRSILDVGAMANFGPHQTPMRQGVSSTRAGALS
jgi:hypothetical protein